MTRRRHAPPGASGSNGAHPPDPEAANTASAISERALVASLILADDRDSEKLDRLVEWLRPAMFAQPGLRGVAAAVLALRRQGLECDPATLISHMQLEGTLEAAGGAAGLADLVEDGYSIRNVEYHAEIVRTEAERRRLRDTLDRALRSAEDPHLSPAETLNWLREWVGEQAAPALAADPREAYTPISVLLAQPELLQPPECVLPRIAYRGRLTLLCGPDKCGKSTFMAHAVARLAAGGSFLGDMVWRRTGRTLMLGMEEAAADQVRRFSDLGVRDGVDLLTAPPPDILAVTHALLDERPADLVVVDSLQEYARLALGTAPDDGDNAAWGSLVRAWVALARRHDVAVVVLHHVRRSDGQFRGAGEIAAAADCLMEMSLDDVDPTVRKVRGRARWAVEPFSVALRDGRYDIPRGELSPGELVMMYVRDHPGCSGREVRENVPGKVATLTDTLRERVARGLIVCVPGRPPKGDRYYIAGAEPQPDPELDTGL